MIAKTNPEVKKNETKDTKPELFDRFWDARQEKEAYLKSVIVEQFCNPATTTSPEKTIPPYKKYQKANYQENKYLKHLGYTSIDIEDKTLIAWTRKGINKYSTSLPLKEYSNDLLLHFIQNKMIRHYPHLTTVFMSPTKKCPKGYYKLVMKDRPFMVFDIDNMHYTLVEEILRNSKGCILQGFLYKVTPSTSGKGSHIWIQVDISFLALDPWTDNKHEGETYYKYGERFNYFCESWEKIADQIEESTGLEIDKSTNGSHIAYCPKEMKSVTEFFKDKVPEVLVFDDVVIERNDEEISVTEDENDKRVLAALQAQEILKNNKAVKAKKHRQQVVKQLAAFLEEFDNMCESYEMGFDIVDEVMEYSEDNSCAKRSGNPKHVHDAFRHLIKRKEDFKNNLINNWDKFRIYALKEKNLGVGVDAMVELFSLSKNSSLRTYIRRIFLYMLNLKITTRYIKKVVTDICEFVEQDSLKRFFTASFLKANWWLLRKEHKIPTVQELALKLGNGNTWATVKKYVPALVNIMDSLDDVIDLMLAGLDLSEANDKNKRAKEIIKFIHRCAGSRNEGASTA